MSAIIKTDQGEIRYSNDFIASIAGMSATECYGVVGMTPTRAFDGLSDLLGRDNLKKGVKVFTDNTSSLRIELNIVVEYGISMSAAGSSILQTVKYTVEKATGLNVTNVNVIISGIRVQK